MSVGLHIDRVGALLQDEQWDLARVMSQSGLRLYPKEPQLLRMSLIASYRLGDLYEALESSRQLISLSDEPRDLYNFGTLALEFNRPKEASAALERVLELQPENLSARANLIAACSELGDLDRAIALSDGVELNQHPATVVANFVCNLATAYRDAGMPEQAMGFYAHAMALSDGWHPVAASNRLYAANFDPQLSAFEIEALHREWGEFVSNPHRHKSQIQRATVSSRRHPRVGLLSGDFRRHSVAYFLEPVLEALQGHAELVALDNSPHHDEVTDRLRERMDGWVSIRALDDEAAANAIEALELDILIDLSGHTAHNRLPLMARRLARKQMCYLGYPNTAGLSQVDVRLVDPYCDPEDSPWRGTETLSRVETGFLAYRGPECEVVRQKQGAKLTFGSFNTPAKVNEALLKVWAEALKAHPQAKLLLKNKAYGSEVVQQRVRQVLAAAGVETSRIEFRTHTASLKAHLETYNELDVALDTFPYQGTTTTCEALFMGVPVVSLCGERHASRVAHTLAHQAGEEWVRCVDTTEAFVKEVSRCVGLIPEREQRTPKLGHDEGTIAQRATRIAAALLEVTT